MNFIKKVFDKKIDNSVHLQFQKFSKGEFKDRAMIKGKKTGNRYSFSTTSEFANELVREVAEKINDKVVVSGAIVTTNDLTGKLDFKDKKQFQGVKRYLIEKEMSKEEITELLDKFPESFFALSFEAGDTKLKIKPKAPKSGKPGKKNDEKIKPDFCKVITTDKKIGEDFIFEKQDFREAEISHTFIIEELRIPEELKNSNDFEKIRKEAKRKGRIVREAVIDGQKIVNETEFEV